MNFIKALLPSSGSWIALAIAFALGAAGTGYVVHRMDAAALANLKLGYAEANTKAVAKAAEKQHQLDELGSAAAVAEAMVQPKIHDRTITTIKEVTRYVKNDVPCISYGLVRVLNAAAAGIDPSQLPAAPGQSDDTCTALKATDVAESIVGNYGVSLQNAEQLNALEAYIRKAHLEGSASK